MNTEANKQTIKYDVTVIEAEPTKSWDKLVKDQHNRRYSPLIFGDRTVINLPFDCEDGETHTIHNTTTGSCFSVAPLTTDARIRKRVTTII